VSFTATSRFIAHQASIVYYISTDLSIGFPKNIAFLPIFLNKFHFAYFRHSFHAIFVQSKQKLIFYQKTLSFFKIYDIMNNIGFAACFSDKKQDKKESWL
jgi:hypothetical protein